MNSAGQADTSPPRVTRPWEEAVGGGQGVCSDGDAGRATEVHPEGQPVVTESPPRWEGHLLVFPVETSKHSASEKGCWEEGRWKPEPSGISAPGSFPFVASPAPVKGFGGPCSRNGWPWPALPNTLSRTLRMTSRDCLNLCSSPSAWSGSR